MTFYFRYPNSIITFSTVGVYGTYGPTTHAPMTPTHYLPKRYRSLVQLQRIAASHRMRTIALGTHLASPNIERSTR